MKTPATVAAVGDELRTLHRGMHLVRRPGPNDDVAHLAVHLASNESSWVTGQDLPVDGGWAPGSGGGDRASP